MEKQNREKRESWKQKLKWRWKWKWRQSPTKNIRCSLKRASMTQIERVSNEL
jgi:hypothetical protein